MEFRLIYRGRLPSGTRKDPRAREKHQLRKEFHRQLRELWKQHPDLHSQTERRFVILKTPSNLVGPPGPNVKQIVPAENLELGEARLPGAKTWVEHIADSHSRCGGRFVPLVSKAGGFLCSLDILFLRRHKAGSLIANGGDIDNRIKVLFDGLRMPSDDSELAGFEIEPDEDPFYCLLEDDNLITRVSVETDRWLLPLERGNHEDDVFLVIHATILNPSAIFAGGRLV